MNTVNLDGQTIVVRVAADAAARTRGLSGVTEMEEAGMLFMYDDDVFVPFNMKQVSIPLTIAFFAADGSFVSKQDMEPGNWIYWPDAKFKYALEYPTGTLEVTEQSKLKV